MARSSRFFVFFVVLFVGGVPGRSNAEDKSKGLSAEDEKLLESLLRDFLFDPRGAQRVKAKIPVLTPWAESQEQERQGWLVKDKAGDRIYFTDGDSVPAPHKDKVAKVDFVAKCRDLYKGMPHPLEERIRVVFAYVRNNTSRRGEEEEPDLVLAAWLWRLGHGDLTARVMAFAPVNRDKEAERVRGFLADEAFNQMVAYFRAYRDEEAWAQGQRLMRLYAPVMASQVGPLLQDLQRRKKQGTFGKAYPQDLPKDFANWDKAKQLTYLLDSLEHSRHHGSEALTKLGEFAVPALLDALEKDQRLTRACYGPSKWHHIAQVIPVREIVYTSLRHILRVWHFDTRQPRDEAKIAQAARAYWQEFGPLPFEARMMRVLNDPRSHFPAVREAAENLANLNHCAGDWTRPLAIEAGELPLALKTFQGPTVGEAFLAAMERDLAHNGKSDTALAHWYFCWLLRLGDRRLAPELAQRADREFNTTLRLRWAHASHRMGESRSMRQFAEEFAAGRTVLPLYQDPRRTREEFEMIIEYLVAMRLPETEKALDRLTEKNHPAHHTFVDGLVDRVVALDYPRTYLAHRSCLNFLRQLLDDKTATKLEVCIIQRGESQSLQRRGVGSVQDRPLIPLLRDPAQRNLELNARRCDIAGELLAGLIPGLPAFHPLRKDSDTRLAEMKKTLDRFAGRWRRLLPEEQKTLFPKEENGRFILDLPTLGRPATSADVKAGKAIFHLDGKGKLADLKLPTRGVWKKDAKAGDRTDVLIVQAELRPDGDMICGIVERHAIRAVSAREFARIVPMPNAKKTVE